MIPRNAEEKGLGRAAGGIEFGDISNQSHESLLHHFLGGFGTARHMQRKTIDWALMTRVKRAKCFFVARPHAAQQVLVSEFGPVRHALFDVSAAPYVYRFRWRGRKVPENQSGYNKHPNSGMVAQMEP